MDATSPTTLLCMEDDPGLGRLLLKHLERAGGYAVTLVEDGLRGLAALRENRYDLALIDYQMPGLNGLEVLRTMREQRLETPALMLTGAGDEQLAVRAIQAGALNYLVKDAAGEYLKQLPPLIAESLEQSQRIRAATDAENRRWLLARVFESVDDGILVTDADNNMVTVNPALCRLFGYDKGEMIGQNPRLFKSGVHDQAFYRRMWNSINTKGNWQGEIINRRKDGSHIPILLSISTLHDERHKNIQHIAIAKDYTLQHSDRERIWRQANYDHLTRLANRSLLMNQLRSSINQAKRNGTSIALLFLDLDDFKSINDQYGHDIGDILLSTIASRLKSTLRESDTIARFGGDEFVALLPNITRDLQVESVARKLMQALRAPVRVGNNTLRGSLSMGIALYPRDAGNTDQLLKCADLALYSAKQKGRHRHCFYSQELSTQAADQTAMRQEIQDALDRHQFHLYYQPVVDLGSRRPIALEALVRWDHPQRGELFPGEFLPALLRNGYGTRLTHWIIGEITTLIEHWEPAWERVPLSINLNIQDTKEPGLLSRLSSLCADNTLHIELQEDLLQSKSGLLEKEIEFLRQRGVQLVIDNYGSGDISLRLLGDLPPLSLKLAYRLI
ncbi:MAG: hypothetical protein B0D85_04190, partial [Candidatus Sedimenticola endophacoides]